jgi:hypothetical protein
VRLSDVNFCLIILLGINLGVFRYSGIVDLMGEERWGSWRRDWGVDRSEMGSGKGGRMEFTQWTEESIEEFVSLRKTPTIFRLWRNSPQNLVSCSTHHKIRCCQKHTTNLGFALYSPLNLILKPQDKFSLLKFTTNLMLQIYYFSSASSKLRI